MNKWFWLAVVMLLPLGCEPEWRMRTSDDGTYSVYLPSSTRKETRAGVVRADHAGRGTPQWGVHGLLHRSAPRRCAQLRQLREHDRPFAGRQFTQVHCRSGGGCRAREFEMTIQQPTRGFASGRLVYANNRLYQLMALGDKHRLSDPEVQKFLNSFILKGG